MNNRPVELEVKHLCKYYKAGKKRVLKAVDDVSFVIHKGETLGIVGESGCGKTTCGKTCIGMLDRTSGEVFYQGKDVHQMSRKERFDFSGKVQMIFQDPYASLDPHQKVYNIVAEGIRIHKLAKTQAEEERMVLELLDMVGLNAEHAMRNVHEFSRTAPENRYCPRIGGQPGISVLRRADFRTGRFHPGADYQPVDEAAKGKGFDHALYCA